jgi:hypothetical protein
MDVAVHFEKVVAGFSRYHKYTLGTELRNKSREIVAQNRGQTTFLTLPTCLFVENVVCPHFSPEHPVVPAGVRIFYSVSPAASRQPPAASRQPPAASQTLNT